MRTKRNPSAVSVKLLVLALLALTLSSFLAACRGQTVAMSSLDVELRLSPQPPVVGPSEVTVELRDAAGNAVEGASVDVEGNMTHAGMKPVLTRARATGGGRYVASGFEFTMAGDWVLTVQAILPGGGQARREFAVPSVATSPMAAGEHGMSMGAGGSEAGEPGVAMAGGEEDEGFAGGVAAAARDTARLAALPLILFAAAWLAVRARLGRGTGGPRRAWLDAPPRSWQVAAVAGLLASALLHVGLIPEHFQESAAYGAFLAVAGGALAVAAAAILAAPSRPSYLLGFVLAAGMVALYAAFRVVPPPGAEMPERVDLVGLVTKAAEVVAAVGSMLLSIRARPSTAGEAPAA